MRPKPSPSPLTAAPHLEAEPSLIAAVRRLWEGARAQAARTDPSALVQANWLIERELVEAQQAGKDRAGHGEALLPALSHALRAEYGSGFSVSGLQSMRGFYLAYPNLIPIQTSLIDTKGYLNIRGNLEPRGARAFYEIEAIRNGWSGRALERQSNSLLLFRLAKSRGKAGVLALAG